LNLDVITHMHCYLLLLVWFLVCFPSSYSLSLLVVVSDDTDRLIGCRLYSLVARDASSSN